MSISVVRSEVRKFRIGSDHDLLLEIFTVIFKNI